MKWHWYVQIDAQQSIMIKVPLYFFKVRFDTSSKMQTYLLLYLVGKNGLKWGRFYLWGMRRIFMIKIFVNFENETFLSFSNHSIFFWNKISQTFKVELIVELSIDAHKSADVRHPAQKP